MSSRRWIVTFASCACFAACGGDSDDPGQSTTAAGGGTSGPGSNTAGPGSTGASTGASTGTGGSGAAGGSGGSGAQGGSGGGGPPALCGAPVDPGATIHYVALEGDDTAGDGSQANPWATISHAINEATEGAVILVKPGIYVGQVRLERAFTTPVRVLSEVPYQALLRNTGTVVRSYYGRNIVLEGFDIAHEGPGGALVVQIQDTNGDGSGSYITIRNNVLHDSYDNDILKINNGASHIVVERNLFYNQTGSDEHMDVNSVEDVVIQDNIFMNDFAGSGRVNGNDTSSFIVVKDSNGSSDAYTGSTNIRIRRNVFLNYEGSVGTNFLLLGEDGNPYYEATDVVIENNLMLGNSPNPMRAAFGCKGVSNVTFRNNTVAGDLPGSAFAMRLNVEGSNLPNSGIEFYNNVWSDPTGSMNQFSTTPQGQTASFVLATNLYDNGGQAVPSDSGEIVNVGDDPTAVLGDPHLGAQAGLALPHWDPTAGQFGDGSSTICQAFEKLVTLYGTPGPGSAAMDQADPAHAPSEDILGQPRGAAPDLGAVEVP